MSLEERATTCIRAKLHGRVLRRAALLVRVFAMGAAATFCAAPPVALREPRQAIAVTASDGGMSAEDVAREADASNAASADAGARDPWDAEESHDPRWAAVDSAVDAWLAAGKLSGCVVVIGTQHEITLKRAYGVRAAETTREPMTLDTVFDMASLTKAVATTSSVMVLVDRGQIGLDEPAASYLPELLRGNRASVTVRQLLLHTAGFVADDPLSDYAGGHDAAWEKIVTSAPPFHPGDRFIYSDVGFIVLGELVRRVSGKDLDAFARENVFAPLDMRETGFLPNAALRERAAPTEIRNGQRIRGEVHDPRAYGLGGVAGHAGLFSTPRDMSRFAQAWLAKTARPGHATLVSPQTFDAFTSPHDVPTAIRGLGWDMMSPKTKSRGDGLSLRAYGHGGYTGTLLWIDPAPGTFMLFLANRVYPLGRVPGAPVVATGEAQELQAKIGTIAASILAPAPAPRAEPAPCDKPASEVLAGIDVLRADDFAALRGRKVALLTNDAARTRDGARTLDALAKAKDVTLVRVLSAEHGLAADQEGSIADDRDPATGTEIVSLYGSGSEEVRMTRALANVDTLVIDIPDVGVRFYTYASTMRHALAPAVQRGLRIVVLDRPNPIDGEHVTGPLPDPSTKGLVHGSRLPVRHGMTLGELTRMFDAEDHLGADLQIIRAQGWRRSDYQDATGYAWTAPSPNLRNLTEAILYPGVALLEGTNVSVGRGTDSPFELIGAPYIDGDALARALNARRVPGVSFSKIAFSPTTSVFSGQRCQGVKLAVSERASLDPVHVGVELAAALTTLYPTTFHAKDVQRLLASRAATDALVAGKPASDAEATWQKDLAAFRVKRDKYLLYRATCPR